MNKINILNRYIESEEIRIDHHPYNAFYHCLCKTFDFDNVESIIDIGCATGILLLNICNNHQNIRLCGIEYFDYHKEHANDKIRDFIKILDIRDDIVIDKYDIVICTEVAEHIDKEYAEVMMNNIIKCCGKYLIMSWSSSGGINDIKHDPHCQHLNPLSKEEYVNYVTAKGFKLDLEKQIYF